MEYRVNNVCGKKSSTTSGQGGKYRMSIADEIPEYVAPQDQSDSGVVCLSSTAIADAVILPDLVETPKQQGSLKSRVIRRSQNSRRKKNSNEDKRDSTTSESSNHRASLAKENIAFDNMIQLYKCPSLRMLNLLATSTTAFGDIDTMVKTSIAVFGASNILLPVVAHVLRWEVAHGTMHAPPFSSNTFAARLVSAAAFEYGKEHLKNFLGPFLDTLLECPGISYEINPSFLAAGENMGENRANLRTLVAKLVKLISGSATNLPKPLQLIWHLVVHETSKRFPDIANDVLSSFVLSKFWGASIACPKAYGVCNDESFPLEVSRALILGSKVLQGIPTKKGFREDYMKCMDSFVKSSAPKLRSYCATVAALPSDVDKAEIHRLGSADATEVPWLSALCGSGIDVTACVSSLDNADIERLYKLLYAHKDAACDPNSDILTTEQAEMFSAAIDTIGVPGPNAVLPVNLSTSILREMTCRGGDEHDASAMKLYPGTAVSIAKYQHMSWDLIDSTYEPATYSDTSLQGADPDIFCVSATLMFNEIDTLNSDVIDRRSHEGNYKIVSGAPRNPMQRTGIRGRGALHRWGPNHCGDPIITRWCRNSDGDVVTRTGRPVLEVLAVKQVDGLWSAPRGELAADASIPSPIANLFHISSFPKKRDVNADLDAGMDVQFNGTNTKCTGGGRAEVGAVETTGTRSESGSNTTAKDSSVTAIDANQDIKNIFQCGDIVFEGYISDARNTDNAWVESTALHFHDDDSTLSQHPVDVATADNLDLAWVTMDEDCYWESHTRQLLAVVSDRLDAHFCDRILPLLCEILPAIEAKGLDSQGLYRLSGSAKNITALKTLVYSSAGMPSKALQQVHDVHELTGLVKVLLRDMNPPLIPYSMYDHVAHLAICDKEAQADNVVLLLLRLPESNFKILSFLLHHLQRVAALCVDNKMTVSNLALVFGPTIARSPHGLAGDVRDQGSQCSATAILLRTPIDVFDTARSQRHPAQTDRLRFDIAPETVDTRADLAQLSHALPAVTSQPIAKPASATAIPRNLNSLKASATAFVITTSTGSTIDSSTCTDDNTSGGVRMRHPRQDAHPRNNTASRVLSLPAGLNLAALKDIQLNDTIADAEEDDSYMMCSSMVEEDNIDSGDNAEDGTPDACPLVIARGAVETHEAEHGDYANIRVAESSNHAGLQLLMSPEGFEPDSYTTIGSNSPDDTAILPDASDARDSALDVVLMSKGEQSVTSSAFSAAARSARSMTDESDCVTVATLSSIGDNPTELGTCEECLEKRVEGWRDPEDSAFYCKSCWEVYDASTDASSETAGSTGTETAPPLVFDDDGLPVDNTHVPDEDTVRPSLQYDEDGLPIQPHNRESIRSLIFDGDGLPCDINDDTDLDAIAEEANMASGRSSTKTRSTSSTRASGRSHHAHGATESLKRPSGRSSKFGSSVRRGTVRISTTDEVSKGELSQLASGAKLSRQASARLSMNAKALQTRMEGPLLREIGSSWKKRYFVLHDSMLKVFKTPSAAKSSKLSEYYNITAKTRITHDKGSKTFQIVIPEKGYTHAVRAHTTKTADEWVRILSNACRIAASIPDQYDMP